jgi:L-2-hydroxyglutarate oxidase LhgO
MPIVEKDFIVIGSGIIGLVLVYKIKICLPRKAVLVIEKKKNQFRTALAGTAA